jgi:RNA polymerase sigma factor (sigma-70 family)
MSHPHPSVRPDHERNALAEENRFLVPWALRRMADAAFVRRHYCDLYEAGIFALIRAASLWKPERGAKFRTYAVSWIKAGIAEERKRIVRRPVVLFIDFGDEDDDAFDPAAPEREEQAPDLDRERLRMAVARIRPQYAHVLNRRYGLDGLCP